MQVSSALLGLVGLFAIANAALIPVKVGFNGAIKFEPDSIVASPGDLIQYTFYAKVFQRGLLFSRVFAKSYPEPQRYPG
jgi:hypothetical protein